MLGQQLKKLRAEFRISQRELAEKLFVSQQAVAKWESGSATPNPETLIKLANIFEITTDILLGKSAVSTSITKIPVLGDHNVNNALAAFIVAVHYGVNEQEAINELSLFQPGAMRQNIIKTNGITVINDCYNSSPSSMQAGLKTLRQISGNRKIAVLGDMGELGADEKKLHFSVGEHFAQKGIDMLMEAGE